jgi:hypothetical protein
MRRLGTLSNALPSLTLDAHCCLFINSGAHSHISPPPAELASLAAAGAAPLHISAPQRLSGARVSTSSTLTLTGKLEATDACLSSAGSLSLATLRGGSLRLRAGGRLDASRLLEGTTVRGEGQRGVAVARLLADDAELAAPAGALRVEAAFSRRLALSAGGGGGLFVGGLHGAAEVVCEGGRVEVGGITGALSVRSGGAGAHGGVAAQFDAPRGSSVIEAEGDVELLLVAPLAGALRVDVARAARVAWELGAGAAYEGGRVVGRGDGGAGAPSPRGGSGKVRQGEGEGARVTGFYDDGGGGGPGEASVEVACKGLLRITLLTYLQLIQRRVAQRGAAGAVL